MDQSRIRNFCIIAHIDHGKSTLADRLLEFTGTVEKRKMRDQLLDQMDIERERGITIKLAPVRMQYNPPDTLTLPLSPQGRGYILNLIDTPGHVDFAYEVSRSLAAVEGALLLVDVSQGVQAQTIGNLHLAQELGLTVIPALNKVDVQGVDIEARRAELASLLGCDPGEIFLTSGKTGQGVPEILEAIIKKIPSPRGQVEVEPHSSFPSSPVGEGRLRVSLRALIFDSTYDDYKGVIAYVRIVDGSIRGGEKISFMGTRCESETLEVGVFTPARKKTDSLSAGEIGYIVTGLKDITGVRVGDTITSLQSTVYSLQQVVSLPGYKELQPMVYAGIYPQEGISLEKLREALLKLKLNDAAMTFEPERSSALGFGFRLGLLGLLHLEIVKERLWREHGIELVVTVPSVAYKIYGRSQPHPHSFSPSKEREIESWWIIKTALELPDPNHIDHIEEPYARVDFVAPKEYLGAVMKLAEERRGLFLTTDYLENRVVMRYEMPLASLIVDLYDKLKSVTAGYASFHYEIIDYRPADVVRLDIWVAEAPVESLATLVYRSEAARVGRSIVLKLKEAIPREQFEVKLQAKVGGKIIAAERISPQRKDVLAKLYGGDVTRKDKLLKKQAAGKRAMARTGRGTVRIPPEAYLAVLKR